MSLRALTVGTGRCRRYRPALMEFVVHGSRGDGMSAALDHLARCRPCEAELTEVALVVTSLRRLGRLAAGAEVGPDAWNRLRVHLGRSREAARRASWLWRLRLGGTMAGVLLVAFVVGPATGGGGSARNYVAMSLEDRSPALVQELRAEAAFIAAVGVGNRTIRVAERGGSIIVNYPDGLRPQGKEVDSKRLDRWPLKAT